jgi:archaellum component FlaG (FlaF/FlaG flagellin family)
VTYHNTVGLANYFKSTITLRDGTEVRVTGDIGAIFLDKNEYKTVVYTTDSDGNPLNLQATDLSGDIFVIYGEGPLSLENTYQTQFEVEVIDVLDDAEVEIEGLYYDSVGGRYFIRVKNIGKADAYVSGELVDLVVNGERITVGGDGVYKIRPGGSVDIPVEVGMDEEDLAANPRIKVRVYYGERELSRIKIKEATFDVQPYTNITRYIIYALIALVIILLIFFLGTKKKCKHCGHKNPRGRKTCEKCGTRF